MKINSHDPSKYKGWKVPETSVSHFTPPLTKFCCDMNDYSLFLFCCSLSIVVILSLPLKI